MSGNHTVGYDTPLQDLSDPDKDYLGSRRIAENIFRLISNSPKEWMVRIGIYGEWGLGKTTILNHIELLARREKWPVVKFNPSFIDEKQELFLEIFCLVIEALEEAGYPIPDKYKLKAGGSKLANFISKANVIVPGSVKPYAKGVSYISGLMGPRLEDLREIVGSNPKSRIIFSIDDLDRCNPEIIPKLLLSINDIISLPGFAFVLPFDDNKVARAIEENFKGEGSGHEFLEKIYIAIKLIGKGC